MAPTIVFDHGRPAVALGSPGGATIITTVLQMLVNHVDFGLEPARGGGGAAGVAAQQRADAGRAGVHRALRTAQALTSATAIRSTRHAEPARRDRRGRGDPLPATAAASRRWRSRPAAAAARRWWCSRWSCARPVRARCVGSAQPHRREAHARRGGPAGRARRARHPSPHADGQRAAGPARGPRRAPGAAAVLGQPPRAGRPPARARGGGRRRHALGRRRGRPAAGLGHDDAAPAARGAPRGLPRHARRRCCSAPATSRTSGSSRRSPSAARSCSPTASATRRSPTAAGSRARRRSSTTTATSSTSRGGCATPTAARR